jgi:hypothetical protein
VESPGAGDTSSCSNCRHARLFYEPEAPSSTARDDEFIGLLSAYRASGGLAAEAEVRNRMRRLEASERPSLQQRIEEREFLYFHWNEKVWLPWFQFTAEFDPSALVSGVLVELGDVFDGWELAHWMATPHLELAGKSPLQLLHLPESVVGAARLTRFVAHS